MTLLNLRVMLGALGLGLLAHSTGSRATTVPYPYLDVIEQGSDLGVSAVGSVPTLTMQGTAISIINGPGNITNLATPATFTLTATYSAALTAHDGQPNTYDFTNGVMTVGSSAAPLLSATVQDLEIQSAQTSLGSLTLNYAIAAGGITYTGGSLAGTLAGGEILGNFTVTSYAATNGSGYVDLSQDFTGNNLTAKVGAIAPVPLPAALPLLLSGLFGAGAFAVSARSRRVHQPA